MKDLVLAILFLGLLGDPAYAKRHPVTQDVTEVDPCQELNNTLPPHLKAIEVGPDQCMIVRR